MLLLQKQETAKDRFVLTTNLSLANVIFEADSVAKKVNLKQALI